MIFIIAEFFTIARSSSQKKNSVGFYPVHKMIPFGHVSSCDCVSYSYFAVIAWLLEEMVGDDGSDREDIVERLSGYSRYTIGMHTYEE